MLSKRQITQFASDTSTVMEYCDQSTQCVIESHPMSDYEWIVFRTKTITKLAAIKKLCKNLNEIAQAAVNTYQTQEETTVP